MCLRWHKGVSTEAANQQILLATSQITVAYFPTQQNCTFTQYSHLPENLVKLLWNCLSRKPQHLHEINSTVSFYQSYKNWAILVIYIVSYEFLAINFWEEKETGQNGQLKYPSN